MSTSLWVDVEGAARTWLRATPAVSDLVAGKVFFGVPDAGPPLPLITVSRIGGAPQVGEAPIDDARLSFSVWAGSKKQAVEIVGQLINAVENMSSVLMDSTTLGYGAHVVSVVWFPDPDTNTPRYVVDAVFTVRAA